MARIAIIGLQQMTGFRHGMAVSVVALILAACGSLPSSSPSSVPAAIVPLPKQASPLPPTSLPVLPPAGSGRGGYYQDDGPGDNPPDGLMAVPDPTPKVEPYSLTGNKPYVVFGQTYTPIVDQRPFKQRGYGSWYGKKFHGQKTSSGELYDMYKMTAAHPILPIPSYARVTNLKNGAQVIVRINDRGPFHSSRIIDLSYTAALKLGYLGKGSGELEVERLLPEEIARIAAGQSASAVQPPVETAAAPDPLDKWIAQAEPAPLPLAVAGTAAALENSALPSGYYLQWGAYAEIGNAEAARAQLNASWDSTFPPLQITLVGLLYRLQGGPFASRDLAALAAQKVQLAGAAKPLIVFR